MKEKIKIIIADDNIKFAKELQSYINIQEDMEVIEIAKDGKQAVEIIKKFKPDIALIDIIMPYIDGIGVLEVMNIDKNNRKTKYIMYSEIHQTKIIQKTMNLGAEYYLLKPFDVNLLIKRIRELTNNNIEKNISFSSINKSEKMCQEISPHKLKNYNNLKILVTNIIHDIGVPAHIIGYEYLREAIILTVNDKNILKYITKTLYPIIATKFKSTPSKLNVLLGILLKLLGIEVILIL